LNYILQGGYVDFCHGAWRIQGSLAVSRGIGDQHLKQWVIAEPDTKVLRIKPEYEFLILASDGLWDKVLFLMLSPFPFPFPFLFFLYCLNPLKDVSTKLLIRFFLFLVCRLVIRKQ